MSVQLKFKDKTTSERRREIIRALSLAGFHARSLFPGQQRPTLASVYTISKADSTDLEEINSALVEYGGDIDFVEAAPGRKLKG